MSQGSWPYLQYSVSNSVTLKDSRSQHRKHCFMDFSARSHWCLECKHVSRASVSPLRWLRCLLLAFYWSSTLLSKTTYRDLIIYSNVSRKVAMHLSLIAIFVQFVAPNRCPVKKAQAKKQWGAILKAAREGTEHFLGLSQVKK